MGADDVGRVFVDGALPVDVGVGIVEVAARLDSVILLRGEADQGGPSAHQTAGDGELEPVVVILIDGRIVGGFGVVAAVVCSIRRGRTGLGLSGQLIERHRLLGERIDDGRAREGPGLIGGDGRVVERTVDVLGRLHILGDAVVKSDPKGDVAEYGALVAEVVLNGVGALEVGIDVAGDASAGGLVAADSIAGATDEPLAAFQTSAGPGSDACRTGRGELGVVRGGGVDCAANR